MVVTSCTVSIMYSGSLEWLSLATTSRKDGPENLRCRSEPVVVVLELGCSQAGRSASLDVLLVILLCMLVGRVDDSPLPSDLFVSSRRNDGKRDEVESLDGAAEGGGWSSAAELALLLLGLLPGRKGAMNLLAMVERETRQGASEA